MPSPSMTVSPLARIADHDGTAGRLRSQGRLDRFNVRLATVWRQGGPLRRQELFRDRVGDRGEHRWMPRAASIGTLRAIGRGGSLALMPALTKVEITWSAPQSAQPGATGECSEHHDRQPDDCRP